MIRMFWDPCVPLRLSAAVLGGSSLIKIVLRGGAQINGSNNIRSSGWDT